jgi:internalin A
MLELALNLITENKKTHSPFLDLGNCGLTEVPQEIAKLVWLEELSFASDWAYFDGKKWVAKNTQNKGPINNITRLAPAALWKTNTSTDNSVKSSPFSGLRKLKKLYLSSDRANSIAYKSMAFNDLSPLSGLASLEQLDVSKAQVTDLSPLSDLTNLQKLFVSKSTVFDLSPLSNLASLQRLDVWDTPVTDLTPFSSLVSLQQLDISDTPVVACPHCQVS